MYGILMYGTKTSRWIKQMGKIIRVRIKETITQVKSTADIFTNLNNRVL